MKIKKAEPFLEKKFVKKNKNTKLSDDINEFYKEFHKRYGYLVKRKLRNILFNNSYITNYLLNNVTTFKELVSDLYDFLILKFYENRHKLNSYPPSHVKNYILRASENRAFDLISEAKSPKHGFQYIKHDDELYKPNEIFKHSLLDEVLDDINTHLTNCKEGIFLSIKLTFYFCYKQKEIAEKLGVSTRMVRKNIKKGFDIIRKEIKKKDKYSGIYF